jgi:outer membrane protein TolC
VEQARRAYEIAQLRYREGISSQLELTDSRLLLEQAEVNRARALRNVQVARARLALLDELPLSVTAGAALVQPVQSIQQQQQQQTPATTVPGTTGFGGQQQ